MQYDPIKRSLGTVFNKTPFLRIVFYKLLDLLLLRAWYVKKELKLWKKSGNGLKNILDAGAGFGQYTYFLSTLSNNWQITSVDIKPEQITDCNTFFGKIGKQQKVTFEYADLTQYIKPDLYDLVITIDVMEHIEQDELVFANFYKSLKPGGMVLISTPSDKGGSDVHDHDEHSFIDEHVRDGYGIEDITIKLQKAGFSRIEAIYTYGTPGSIAWKLSMKYPIIMLNASKLFFIILPLYYLLVYPWAFVLNYLDTKTVQNEGTGLLVKAWK